MNKKLSFLLPAVLALTLAVGIFIGGKLHFYDSPERLFSTNSKKDKLNRLIDFIEYEYVDEINTDSIVDVTVNDILGNLDPHSVYIPKSEMQEVAENMKGDFVGIGVSFRNEKDTITVVRPIIGGPSDQKGIQAGDKIMTADDEILYGKDLANSDIIAKLKGKIGSDVTLGVYRPVEKRFFKVKVTRDRVPIRSVEAQYMLTSEMGYIKINRFAESTYNEFVQSLDQLLEEGAEKLVLDLRDNPGGYLGIAELLADEFLEEGKLILFTKNKKGRIKKAFATKEGAFEGKPIYVLINERSASASEIIAGALQDNDIGTIVGRRSFGKGLVQREMDLGDGSAVRLTVSRYYTPTGRSIQRSYAKGYDDYYQNYMERYLNGELVSPDSIKVADSLRFVTPKGKVVYGGGGIIPDVFVPIGSLDEEKIRNLEASGFFSAFVFDFLEKDRSRFMHYPESEFYADYRVDDLVFEQFVDFVLNRKVRLDFYAHEKLIKTYIKANLAEQLYSPNVGAQVLSREDRMIQEVLRIDIEANLKESAEEQEVPSKS